MCTNTFTFIHTGISASVANPIAQFDELAWFDELTRYDKLP